MRLNVIQKLRFGFAAIFAFLLVTGGDLAQKAAAVLLCGLLSFNSTACYGFLGQGEVVSAVEPPSQQIDLTGTWIGTGDKFTLNQSGCTKGWAGQLTADGQDVDKGAEITVTQRGNQLIIPAQQISYSGASSGGYTQRTEGTISGRTVTFKISASPAFGRFVIESKGTVSNDGNKIEGDTFCQNSAGPATARGKFTWIRKQQGAVVYIWSYRGYSEAWGHASMQLNDKDKTYISWWSENVRLKDLPKIIAPFKAYQDQTFIHDKCLEANLGREDCNGENESKGKAPDIVINVPCVDEEKIKTWWLTFKKTHAWQAQFQNCSTIIAEALYAGGAWNILSPEEIMGNVTPELGGSFYPSPNAGIGSAIVWTPNKVAEMAKVMVSNCATTTK